MNQSYPNLFSELRIGRTAIRNRIVVPPMLQCRSIISPEGIVWYRRMALGGAGLIIVEATSIQRFGTELTPQNLSPLVQAIRQCGAFAAIQLFPTPFGQPSAPNTLSEDEIKAIIDQYATAAKICRQAGFEAVEPHGAHGFLINQFFMSDRNQRTDAWGGSLERRCKFGTGIVQSIRQGIGEEMSIFYRHTPVGVACTINDSLEFAARLINAGVDVLDISPARQDTVADLAAPFKKRFPGTPVIAVGGMDDPDAAEQALAGKCCDLVAIGRGLIADSQWPKKVQQNRIPDILRCTRCNQGCFGRIKKGEPVICEQWVTDELR